MHWLSAAIILSLLILGIYMTPYDENNSALANSLYFWHKSFGILVFIITIARIFNRKRHYLLESPKIIPKQEQRTAKIAHQLLYLFMVLIPLLGYCQSSSCEFSNGVNFFFIDLPEILPKSEFIFDITNSLHKWLSYFFIVLILAHVLGALKHRFFDKENDVLDRIL